MKKESLLQMCADSNHTHIFEKYRETFYQNVHDWRDYELTSAGFKEWYHDCLPRNRNAKILDIGCGDGKFLFYLKQNDFEFFEGLEISLEQIEEAKKNVNCPIHYEENTETFLKENPSSYEMITMNDVLEHIPKDKILSLLKSILGAIQPNGYAVINVPQASGLMSGFRRYNDFTHEILFTELSLTHLLSLAGFQKIRYVRQKIPFKLTPRHLLYRIARCFWFAALKIIYSIESPGEKPPANFQGRLVAVAFRQSI